MSRANKKRSAQRRVAMLRTQAARLAWAEEERRWNQPRPLRFSDLGLTREQVELLERELFSS